MYKVLLAPIVFVTILSACAAKSSLPTQSQSTQITQGIPYTIIKNSQGNTPKLSDEVEIRFTAYSPKGELLEGTLNGVPVIVPVETMFEGLQRSVMSMPVGAIYEFRIPAHLGYQEEGKAARQSAIYRIELLSINP